MKSFLPMLPKKSGLLLFACLTIALSGKAQTPAYSCYITNEVHVSNTVYQFDVYLLSTGSNSFLYAGGQWGITVNSAVANGGVLTASVVGGSTTLSNNGQAPISVSLPSSTYVFNIQGRTPPGAANASVISNVRVGCSSPGTRIATFQITNSVAFAANTHMNHTFNFVAAAGATQTTINAYVGGINTDVTSSGTFFNYLTPGTCLQNLSVGCNLAASATSTSVSCSGGSNGTATVSITGGTSPFSYLWNNGQTSQTATALAAGSYSATVTDAGGCTAMASTTVSQPSALSASSSVVSNVSCNGGSNGSVSVAASGGTAPYSGTGTFTGLGAGTYTYIVTDAHGCTASTSVTVSQPTVLSALCSGTNVSVNGGSNGSASVVASGGTPSYNYSWSNGLTTSSISGLIAGTYSVTVSDAHGCAASCSYTVTQPAASNPLVVACSGTDVSCSGGGSDGSVSVIASGGTPFYSYLWSNGATTSSVSNLGGGTYTITVTDAVNATATCSDTVHACNHLTMSLQNCSQPTCNTIQFDLYVVSDGSPTSDLRASAFQYGVNLNTAILQSGATIVPTYVSGTSDFIPPLAAFSFPPSTFPDHIRIVQSPLTANTGNTMTVGHLYKVGTFILTSSSKWVANSNPAISLQSTVVVGKTVTASVVWVGSSANPITISTTGTGNNLRSLLVPCTLTLNSCNLSASASSTPVSCFNGSNGTATVSASGICNPVFHYLWSNGQTTQTAINLAVGSYSVTVTDDIGCTTTTTVSVSQPSSALSASSSVVTNVSCNSGSNGSVSVAASGGTSPYSGTGIFSGLGAGTYTYVVTDANGCTATTTVTVTQPTVLSASSLVVTNVSCNGGSNGSVSVTANGGTAPYSGTGSFSGLGAGIYSYTVSDAHGCTTTTTVTITQPTALTASSSVVTNVSCNGGSNGSVSVTASGGTSPYSGTGTFTGLGAGTYSYTVTDSHGCTATTSITVSQSTALTANSLVVSNVTCHGGSNGSVSVAGSGGTAPYSGTGTFSGLVAGNYTYIVTDAYGCTASTTVTVSQPTTLSASSSIVTNISCNGGSNGSVSVAASGGTSPYSGTGTFAGLGSGSYTYIVTDAHGCTATTTVTVTQPTALSVSSLVVTNVSCNGGSNGSVSVAASGGTAPYSGTGTFTGLAAGTYSYTVTDSHGCTATTSVSISQPAELSMGTCSHTDISCFGGSNGTASAGTISNAVGTVHYLWSNGQITAIATGLSAGTYTLTVSDNCFSLTCTQTVNQPATALLASCSGTDVSCTSGSNGTVSIAASGGTPSYSYLWSNGAITSSVTNLGAATYSVTVTDSHGCTATCSYTVNPCNHLTMSLQNCSQPTCNTIQFDLYVVSDGSPTSDLRANAFQYGINFNTSILQSGATIATSYVSGSSDIAPPLAGFYFPGSSSPDHIRIIENPYTGSNTGTTMTIGHQYKVGTFIVTSSAKWVANSNPSFALQTAAATGKTITAAVVWVGNATLPITISTTGTGTNQRSVIVSCSLTLNTCNLSATASSTPASCGGNNGTATVSASGICNPVFTYLWSNGQITQTATGLSAGNYSVTVTDDSGCSTVASVTVSQSTQVIASQTHTNVSCNGGSNGSVTVSASGGTAPYSGTGTFSGLAAGSYTYTVTDANGCTATTTAIVSQPSAISANGQVYPAQCNGGTGGIGINPSGGTGPGYTVSWSNGSNSYNLIGLTAGSYTVTITDANSCTATATFTVTQPTALSVSTSSSNVSCNGGSNGSAGVTASGGTPSYSYQWTNTQTTQTVTGLSAGNYSVTVTDAGGCTTIAIFAISQPSAISANGQVFPAQCPGSTGGISINPSGGTGLGYTVSWSNGSSSYNLIGLTAGNYSVTITDQNNCTATASYTVTAPSAISANGQVYPAQCNGGTGGIGINPSGGTGPGYTVSWSNGSNSYNLIGLTAGSYTVTITDANSCTATATFTVTQPTALSVSTSSSNISCNGGSNGSAGVTASGGTPSYSYQWTNSQTTQTITGLSAGNYSVTVTDAGGCTTIAIFAISQPSAISANGQVYPAQCPGGTGAISINPSGGRGPGYTVLWSNGSGSYNPFGLTAGNYTVTITDQNNCTATASYTVTAPSAISANGQVYPAQCNGGTGGISINPSGGTGPGYTVSWSNGSNSYNLIGLTAGSYTVTITDANSCTSTATFTVTQPSAVSASSSATNVSCNGGSNGSVTVAANGGTAPYSGTGTFSGLAAGSYTYIVTDANGCMATTSATVSQPSALSASSSASNVSCNGGSNGSVSVAASGGTAPYSGTGTFSGLAAGTYTYIVTDAHGCTATTSATVSQPSALSASSSATNVSCNAGSNGSVSVFASGGTAPYSGTGTFSGLAAGTYTYIVTDAHGCTATTSVTVSQPSALSANSSVVSNASCNGGSNGSVSVAASGGTAPYSGTGTFSGLAAGTYTYVVTDAHGCTATTSATITQPSAISVSLGSNTPVCAGSAINLTSSALGGSGSLSYAWTGPNTFSANGANQTINFATPADGGTYTLVVTDGHSCSTTATTAVVVQNCNATLNLKAFLQGFYRGSSTMVATLHNLGYTADATITDTIQINLWAPTHLSNANPDFSVKTLIHTNGTAAATFSGSVVGNSYYVAVKHRNSMETWSAAPVTFTPVTSYDFSTAESQAYGDGINPPLKNMGSAVFAFYGGDENQDGNIDISDMGDIDNATQAFLFGYNPTDINGDGATDVSDMAIVDNNSQLFLYYARPY